MKEILARFDAERRAFLEKLFALAKGGRTWDTIVLADAVKALGGDRERIVKALTYLEEKGDLELKVTGVRQGYRVVRVPGDLSAVWHELRRRFAQRESSDITRVAGVAELVSGKGCLVRRLLHYFGEDLGHDCGHCGPCAGDPRAVFKRAPAEIAISNSDIVALRAEYPRALGGARQVARFLCGIASPKISKEKLTRHPRFGSAVEVPFAVVMQTAKTALAEKAGV